MWQTGVSGKLGTHSPQLLDFLISKMVDACIYQTYTNIFT